MLPLGLAALNRGDQYVTSAVGRQELNPPFPHVIARKAAYGSRIVRAKLVGDRRGERGEYFSHSYPKTPA
jgi:hypothetical protein